MKHSEPKTKAPNDQTEVRNKPSPATPASKAPAGEPSKEEKLGVSQQKAVTGEKKTTSEVETPTKPKPVAAQSETATTPQSTAEKKTEATTPAQESAKPKPFTALVTDDNYFNRDIFRMALEDAGFVVDEAENGKGCQAALAQKNFDLLVLDLQMPDLSGLDILRDIDEKKSKGQMSILVVTANPHMVTEDVEDKADYTMQKPVDVAAFSTFVKRLIERKRR